MSYAGTAYSGEAYVGAPGAPAPASVNPIEFLLYDETNTDYLGLLDQTTGRKWSDPLNDAGGGEFEIHADHPLALAALTDANGDAVYDNVVRCRLNGVVRYAFLVRENKKSTAKADEEVGRVLRIGGPGTLAYFQQAVVYPERGIGRASSDVRLFNWTAFSFNDSSWVPASEKTAQGTPYPGSAWNDTGVLFPRNFPDPTAQWIWGSSGTADIGALAGDCYFRKRFTISTVTGLPAKLAFTCDNGMDLYIDNAFIATKSHEKKIGASPLWTQGATVDYMLDQGEHLIAVKGHNQPFDELGSFAALNTAGLLVAVHEAAFGQSEDQDDWGDLIVHTDSSWKVLEYPPGGPPGMTTGEVLRILFTEAQTRGALPGVTWNFTDANDSDGNPWAVVPDLGVQVGHTYYAMLRQLTEVACDLHMDPESMRLDAFNQRGSASSTTLQIASNITDLEHQGTGDMINTAILRYANGWRESSLPSSIAANGRHEGFLSLGTAPSVEQGLLAAQALFAEVGTPRDAIVVTHEGAPGSGEEPYADYDVADTITVPARDGQPTVQSVKAITVSEDPEGNPIITPEVQALSEALESRIQRWVKRMSAGTAAGQSENASPFVPSSSEVGSVLPPEALPATSGFRYATVVVAASDSLHADSADFVCTGTADQTTINAALDSLQAGASQNEDDLRGGRVVLMEGTYSISGSISPTAVSPNFHDSLEGQGQSTILKVSAGFASYVIDLDPEGNSRVANLHIDGNGQSVTGAVRLRSLLGTSTLEDVVVRDMTASTAAVTLGTVGLRCVVQRCQIKNITGDAINISSISVVIRDCIAVSGISGFAVSGAVQGTGFIVNSVLAGATGGIANAHSCFVVNNSLSGTTGPAVAVTTTGGPHNSTIVGNLITMTAGTGAHAISLAVDGAGLVAHNTIFAANSTSFDAINVAGDRWSVLNNYIFVETSGTQWRTGIRTETTADRTAIVGNVIRNLTTALNNLGTNTQLSYSGGASGDNLVFT